MGLVDYSESDSSDVEVDAPAKPIAKAAPAKKPAFQKVVDRSNPGKIIVNLPQATSSSDANASNSDGPPAKRARTGAGGGLFSGFNSFLPAPKNAGKPILGKSLSSQARPGINLKTSAEKGFSRDEEPSSGFGSAEATSESLSLPPPKRAAEPSIPDTMKPAEEVKLVGKPLMFRPLSVARNTKKKPLKSTAAQVSTASKTTSSIQTTTPAPKEEAAPAPAPPPKKTSLFSLHVEETSEPASTSAGGGGAYEPLFETGDTANPYSMDGLDAYSQQMSNSQVTAAASSSATRTESLDSIANDLNLSAAARRELFGRGGNAQMAKKVINFNMDQEYQHNEEIRAAGEQQMHNPVRSIQSGKHSLRQLVQNVSNQREALEESFAKGKSNRREASSRYGW
ncbi:stress activated map kinase interacting [Trichoderma arundinaceum]|uniref:Stress activated map kinase interacting n=1 Tax=Trichoderma arundinaceum TaxID=490622 RepID=A0A395NA41_TRIAR|nr:stress activated map kinase interacting [Trichoderma arundinaceum]